jgi:hypothetical protein
MMLPNRERAFVERSKIEDYLLSLAHPGGRGKAEFFIRYGFRRERWAELAFALRGVGISNQVTTWVESLHGVRYVIDGLLLCPDHRNPRVCTIWLLQHWCDSPRLITAYPSRGNVNGNS